MDGSATVLDQLQRLATCSITYQWETITPGRRDLRGDQLFVVSSYHFWHLGATTTSEAADGGSITLSDKFWSEVVSSCFPLDFRKAQMLRGNPTAYDLYLWLTYRLGALQRSGRDSVALSYDDLHAQLGSHYQCDTGRRAHGPGQEELRVQDPGRLEDDPGHVARPHRRHAARPGRPLQHPAPTSSTARRRSAERGGGRVEQRGAESGAPPPWNGRMGEGSKTSADRRGGPQGSRGRLARVTQGQQREGAWQGSSRRADVVHIGVPTGPVVHE